MAGGVAPWCVLVVVLSILCPACDKEKRVVGRARPEESIPHSSPAEVVSTDRPADREVPEEWPIVPTVVDEAYDSEQKVAARRLVYRITLRVPAAFGNPPTVLAEPAAELYVDVNNERLRARFEGPAWPVESGTEVRLRADRDGVYVFDSKGGRALVRGQMAAWFQGGDIRRRHQPPAGILPPLRRERVGPGALLCALVAEWSNQTRDVYDRRCAAGGAATRFRLGPWRADRTADLPVELSRHELRADHKRPPPPVTEQAVRRLASPEVLAGLRPGRGSKRKAPPGEPVLRFSNQGTARALLTASGVAIAWLDPGANITLHGLSPGTHYMGALRPLGNSARYPRIVMVPGEFSSN